MDLGPGGLPFKERLKRYDTPGDAHYLTFSCYRRQRFLDTDDRCLWLATALTQACRNHAMSVCGYVFMPEHAHILVHPHHPVYDTARFVQAIKLSVTNKAQALRRSADLPESVWDPYLDIQPNGSVHFRFWQRGGGYDRNVSDERAIADVLEYIHNNPVKRGLCETPQDWIWSSARAYAGLDNGPVPIEIISMGGR
jgi:putative transposase